VGVIYSRIAKVTALVFVVTIAGIGLGQLQGLAVETAGTLPGVEVGVQETNVLGQAACAACHSTHNTLVNETVHASPEVGCESCHGGGGPHARAMATATTPAAREVGRGLIFSFDQSPTENAEQCINCHEASRVTQHFDHSEHQLNGVACQDCHSPHLTGNAGTDPSEGLAPLIQRDFFNNRPLRREEDRWLTENLLRDTQPELCFSCHSTIEGQFALPTHHPVPEGLVACTDCHNPHGTRNEPMLQSANWETCVGCHVEKRGPFIFEHAPVKLEGCITCHTPHGSVNRNLLVRREERFLCLQCHVDPLAPNVPHGRLGFQTSGDCVRCHVTVHGSNSSHAFLD
jgi:predicted CXXCH cytochrome family protein